MAPILQLRALKAFYGQSEVVHGIDLAVEEGGMTVLLGANGAGKTTTLRAICGMVRSEGEIVFADKRLDRRATEDIAALGVAHVPEGRGTFVALTVEENLRLGGYTRLSNAPANIERMYAVQVGERPPPSAMERLIAKLAETSAFPAKPV